MLDVVADDILIKTNCCDVEPACPKAFAHKISALAHKIASNINGTFPSVKANQGRHRHFGGMLKSICTWSGRKCPSITWHSFCSANARKAAPSSLRIPLKIFFFLYLGIQTTWYLHSHFVWLKLCFSSIESLLSLNFERFVTGGFRSFPERSNFVTPGRAGVYL